ncbi:hypothetical protein FNYG_07139 [Fusarium nygamai]|uniref:Uncharacterized protein n=1 Tax=Gibberella nygamai TaxID=42673 RepID=A0A2K0WB78_GIBNY|nr:hypothetical protein FNYG_07139 [Fusarium nygamai]
MSLVLPPVALSAKHPNAEDLARVCEAIMRESGSTMIRYAIEPASANDSGTSGARGGSCAVAGSLPRSDFATVTSSGGVMGVSNGPARAAQAAPETEPAPADMDGDKVVNGNSNSTH